MRHFEVNTERFRFETWGGGVSLALTRKSDGASFHLQGDDASQFLRELDERERTAPDDWTADQTYTWMWDQGGYGDAASAKERKLIIQICPREPSASACLTNGESVLTDSEITEHVLDCVASGDCQPACEYVRDVIGVDFRIVARNAAGEYENRAATAEEKAETCRKIYFDSETDFSDESTAETYLIWEAASGMEAESQESEQ